MDSKKVATTGVYDDVYEKTTFYPLKEWGVTSKASMGYVGLVKADGDYVVTSREEFNTDNSITVEGDWTKEDVIIGVPYQFSVTLSPIYLRSINASTGVTKAVTNGRLQLRDVRVDFGDTGAFYVYVSTRDKTRHYTYTQTQKLLHNYELANTEQYVTGTLKCPVNSINTGCKIWIESYMPLPVNLLGLEWYGKFIPRSTNGG